MKFTTLFSGEVDNLIHGDRDVDILDITIDSRKVKPGTCFIAIRGAVSDGHDFIEKAIEAGAAAIIAEEVPEGTSVPYAIVDDTRLNLGFIAAEFFGRPSESCKVIGVTGTNGKTTTAHIISHILEFNDHKVGRIGTTGVFWPGNFVKTPNTTPESIVLQRMVHAMCDDEISDLCIEVSSHGLETGRLNGLLFDVGVFLNLTQDHLNFHGSMERYFNAKKRLFTEQLEFSKQAGKDPRPIISVDSPEGHELLNMKQYIRNPITFGISGGDFHASDIVSDLNGTRFTLTHPDGSIPVKTNLIGAFNVSNILASIAACKVVGVTVEDSVRALSAESPINVDGRLERVVVDDDHGRHVFVDFAHTPDALENVLKTLREIVGDKKIWLVFGAGGDRDRSKRKPMGEVGVVLADYCVVTNDNPRTEDPRDIVDEIVAGKGNEFTILLDRKQAIRYAISESQIGDVVLIAGKGHEAYQEIKGIKVEFSDSKIAQEVLDSFSTRKDNVQ